MEDMSDINTLVRKVAQRVLGADSPAIDAIAAAVMTDLTTALRERQITISQIRSHAKQLAQVKATRAFAVERRELPGLGRESSVADVRVTRALQCSDCIDTLIAELQRAAAEREAAPAVAKAEALVVAA